jgi:hypothetical protein
VEENLVRELDRIHQKLDKLDVKLDGHIDRIARVETHQRGMATVLTLLMTSAIGVIAKMFT